MDICTYKAEGRTATLYMSDAPDRPLIVLNNFSGDGASVAKLVSEGEGGGCNLLCVGDLQWNHDMSPWPCPPLLKDDAPFTGGADEYLNLLLTRILPEAKELVKGSASYFGIAGYSLAGLFALYAMYNCDIFTHAASMSGSLWFPDFKDYVLGHELRRKPDKIYVSLGDKEAKTKNALLSTVQENTEEIVRHFRDTGLSVEWELNPGNHFKDVALRSAKGILGIL